MSLNIGAIGFMSRKELAAELLNPTKAAELAVVDVRDGDHDGPHITSAIWVPSPELAERAPELARELRGRRKVVFHCTLSQMRGPSAALKYARARRELLGEAGDVGQAVCVLREGFEGWKGEFGGDARLTVRPAVWKNRYQDADWL